MKASVQRFFDYFLIGVLGVLPILIVVQVVLYVERLLRDFVLNIYGRYEDKPLLPALFFAAAVAFLITSVTC